MSAKTTNVYTLDQVISSLEIYSTDTCKMIYVEIIHCSNVLLAKDWPKKKKKKNPKQRLNVDR